MNKLFQTPNIIIIAAVLLSVTEAADEVIYAQVGGTATFFKTTAGADRSSTYVYWYHTDLNTLLIYYNTFVMTVNQDKWRSRVSLSDYSLTIKAIEETDFGIFICKLMKFGKDFSITTYRLSQITVSVTPGPVLLLGESVSLSCNTDAPPEFKAPEIHWVNPRGEVKNKQVTVTATGGDSGVWTCVVKGGSQTSAKTSVTVIDLSPHPSGHQYTSQSSSFSIPCSIPAYISWEQLKARDLQGGRWLFLPEPAGRASVLTGTKSLSNGAEILFSFSLKDLTWTPEQNRGLRTSDLKKGNLTLTKWKATEADKGEYVCSLDFENGLSINRTIQLEMLQIVSSAGTEITEGQPVNLTCSLSHTLPPQLHVKWFPPATSSPSALASAPHPDRLTIPEVSRGESGKWRCELWQSSAQLTSAVTTLRIKPRHSVWLLVTICGVTVIVILLLILAVILICRHRQKMKHPRRRLCQCKHPKPKGFYRT
ncbi:uncharacterized protein LOC117514154 isoform X2 [Thalassophryne amazonica]|uniref:uncharacterized protein LOC117514154 isoform X2 n=1 Tax=Thalassophryne amazonica TaxID=390379 RepID=UPI001471A007|nr:uncharacterized protein LOC117514154 isoform X2 [Thalassophryne amazonica]